MSDINADISAQVSFTMRKGDTYNLPFQFLQADGVTPIDMTGCHVLWQFRKGTKTGDLMQTVTDTSGGSWSNSHTFQPNFIVAMEAGVHWTDFQITTPGGVVTTWFEGKVTVNQDVSE